MNSGAQNHCQRCGESSGELTDGMCPDCGSRFLQPERLITRHRLLEVLADHVGAAKGLNIEQLVAAMIHPHAPTTMLARAAAAAWGRNVRELVMQLRLDGHHICAHPRSGYYLAANDEELNEACDFLYDRAMRSLQQVAAMKRVSLPDLRGQLHLPT